MMPGSLNTYTYTIKDENNLIYCDLSTRLLFVILPSIFVSCLKYEFLMHLYAFEHVSCKPFGDGIVYDAIYHRCMTAKLKSINVWPAGWFR